MEWWAQVLLHIWDEEKDYDLILYNIMCNIIS